jgi:acyl-CoA thioester hydrolase
MIPNPPQNAFDLAIEVTERDVDDQGHASNVAVVRWFSRGAYAHSAALGWDLQRYREAGAWFVVRRHEIDYHAYAQLGDRLILTTWPNELGKATAERHHVLRREGDDALIAAGRNVWAYVDVDSGRPKRIPEHLRALFCPPRGD